MNRRQEKTDSMTPASASHETIITVRNLGKRYGDFQALTGVNLDVRTSEVTCLIGPSGSGKSTLLRCLNFLESYEDGEVRLDGELIGWQEGTPRRPLPARRLRDQRRHIGMVFQQFNLWPHMTAEGNVAEALVQVRGMAKAEARERAMAALETVNLADKAANYPSALSGGQQQRVAVARALARAPQVLLLDEPFSAVDKATRQRLYREVAELLGISMQTVPVHTRNIYRKLEVTSKTEAVFQARQKGLID